MTKTTIVLELTDREADSLAAILMRGVHWSGSGTLGEDAQGIYAALSTVRSVKEADFRAPDTKDDSYRDWVEVV